MDHGLFNRSRERSNRPGQFRLEFFVPMAVERTFQGAPQL